MALPRGAMGLSAVCDCGISWSYSLTILVKSLFKKNYKGDKEGFICMILSWRDICSKEPS